MSLLSDSGSKERERLRLEREIWAVDEDLSLPGHPPAERRVLRAELVRLRGRCEKLAGETHAGH